MTNIINKITVRSVFGDKKAVLNAATEEGTPVMRAVGIARSYETGEGDNGPWVRFKGSFQGINIQTGEVYASGKLFLPEVGSDMLQAQLDDEANNAVEFGFDVVAVEDDTSAVGYVYTVRPLIEPAADNPLDRLLATMPALPSPKAQAEPEPEKAPTKKAATKKAETA